LRASHLGCDHLEREPWPETQLLLDLVQFVMQLDAKLDRVLYLLGEENGDEEADT
jgi:hypothetical protein